MKVAPVLLVCAMPMLTPAAFAQSGRATDEAALTRIKTEIWPGYYRSQNAEGLASFLHPQFVNIAPDGSVTTRAQELQWVRDNAWSPENFRYTIEAFVWLSDDLVIVVGRGESDRTDDGGAPCRHSYASSNLLERAPQSPNGWRALSSHVSGDGCAPA